MVRRISVADLVDGGGVVARPQALRAPETPRREELLIILDQILESVFADDCGEMDGDHDPNPTIDSPCEHCQSIAVHVSLLRGLFRPA